MIERFLAEVERSHVKEVSPEVLQDALREMRGHLEDSRDAFLTAGAIPDEAEVMAVKAFGDPSLAVPPAPKFLLFRIERRDLGYLAAQCGLFLVPFAIIALSKMWHDPSAASVSLTVAALLAFPLIGGFARKSVRLTSAVTACAIGFLWIVIPTDAYSWPWQFPAPPSQVAWSAESVNLHANRTLRDLARSYAKQLSAPHPKPFSLVDKDGVVRYPTTIASDNFPGSSLYLGPPSPATTGIQLSPVKDFPNEKAAIEDARSRLVQVTAKLETLIAVGEVQAGEANARATSPLALWVDAVPRHIPGFFFLTSVWIMLEALGACAAHLVKRLRPRRMGAA